MTRIVTFATFDPLFYGLWEVWEAQKVTKVTEFHYIVDFRLSGTQDARIRPAHTRRRELTGILAGVLSTSLVASLPQARTPVTGL